LADEAPFDVKVAVLGAGKMGTAIARRLAAEGLEVVVWNRTRARAEAVGVGVVADTPADAVREADMVLSILSGPDAVREAYTGAHGALEAAGQQVFAEMSTAGPDVSPELEARVRERGGALLEAPVLGSVPAIEKGELLILAGGDEATIAKARPVLDHLGTVMHVGPVGYANRLKLVANSMLGIVSAAAAELQAAGVAAGLDKDQVFSVLKRLVPYLEARRAGYLAGRYEPVTFALKDILKDLDLSTDFYGGDESLIPFTKLARDVYADVVEEHGTEEMSAINERFRR
jgi:3-hydroxyisobutyrate dehydrogenase-like beta-hydroxyacid dehydrogenase